MKKPFGSKSAEIQEVSGSSARAEALRTAHARPRAGTPPGRLSPGSGTQKQLRGADCSPGRGFPGSPGEMS